MRWSCFEENSFASVDVGTMRHNIDFTVLPPWTLPAA